jgi:hypothetical protein
MIRLLPPAFVFLLLLSLSAASQTNDRAQIGREIESLRAQIREREAQFLQPAQADSGAGRL